MASTAKRNTKSTSNVSTAQKSKGEKTMTTKKETTKKFTPEVTITQAEFGKLSTDDVYNYITGRISQERAQKVLLQIVADGRVAITDPSTVMQWTYKRVVVKDVAYDGLGMKNPQVTLSEKEFEELDGKGMAELLTRRISVERSKDIILALLKAGIIKPTADEVGIWTYNRVMVEGCQPSWSYGTGANGMRRQEVSIAGVVAKSA